MPVRPHPTLSKPWRPTWYALLPFVLGCLAGIIYVTDLIMRWAQIAIAPWQAMSFVSMYIVLPITTAVLAWLSWVVPILGARDVTRPFAHTPRGRLRVLHLLVWSSMIYLSVCALFCLAIDPFDRLFNDLPLHWTPRMTIGVILIFFAVPLFVFNRMLCRHVTIRFHQTVRLMGLCFECKYDLRARPQGACPECGWEDEKPGGMSNEISR